MLAEFQVFYRNSREMLVTLEFLAPYVILPGFSIFCFKCRIRHPAAHW